MDKAVRALDIAENAMYIAQQLQTRLPTVLEGKIGGGVTAFGEISAEREGVAVVIFDGASTDATVFGTRKSGESSPMFLPVPKGAGELALCDERANARAIIFWKN